MIHSLQYYLLKVFIRLKRVKQNFNSDPINFHEIRKSDIHNPKAQFFNQQGVNRFVVANTHITEFKKGNTEKKLLIFIHGGAFVSGPNMIHWEVVKQLAKKTDQTIWLCDYPQAPEYTIREISNNIDLVYQKAIEQFEANQIILLGDSVGGTLVISLVQRLISNSIQIPQKIILISPVCDATFSNPSIPEIEAKDIMLTLKGVKSAKRMCAGSFSLDNNMLSPINGSFRNFPKTIIYSAQNDITFPDQLLVANKLTFAQIEHEIIIGKGMPHIWPFLPLMPESKKALMGIIKEINQF